MKFVGEEKIASLVKTDLSQLKVVPYYGCLLGRPGELTGEKDIEQPMMMDLLLQAAGVDVKWWNYKTECCGATVGMPKAEIQRQLSGKIIEQALAAGADAIVVACPLCHVNLDLKQGQINRLPRHRLQGAHPVSVAGAGPRLRPERRGRAAQAERGRPDGAREARPSPNGMAIRAEEERKAAEKAAKDAAKAAKAAEGRGSRPPSRPRPPPAPAAAPTPPDAEAQP